MNKATKPPFAIVVTKWALFLNFTMLSLTGFGGLLPWTRRMLVEKRGWLTSLEFAETWSLGQILPGPNVVNVAIMVGSRFHGAIGALLAFGGLLLAPLVVILLLAILYTQYGQLAFFQHIFHATGAASAGLVVATGFRMVANHPRSWHSDGIALLTFISFGISGFPILAVLAGLGPLSIALAWRNRA